MVTDLTKQKAHLWWTLCLVGDKGLEPSTSRSQTARASQLRQSPTMRLGYYTLFTSVSTALNVNLNWLAVYWV